MAKKQLETDGQYEEWFRKIQEASQKHELKHKQPAENSGEQKAENTGKSKKSWILPIIIFFLALIPRLLFLYSTNPQNAGFAWYGDVYHHWQIAYFSKTVGFFHGFLRLWDLKGMEYYWGLMHPLVLATIFTITGSVDIIIQRFLSIISGSFTAVFIFILVKRYFNIWAALAAGIWIAFFPVTLFSDTLGMQEQLGMFFLLAGIIVWPRHAILTGILWAFASMVRAEYWLFSLFLIFTAVFYRLKGHSSKKIAVLASYLVLILLYMKYLANYTNNPIYPIWWNYFATVAGQWIANASEPLDPNQLQAQWVARVFLLIGAVGMFLTFIKRPKYSLLFMLGFLNITFISFMFSVAAYAHGYFDRFLVDRLFSYPYVYLAVFLIIFFFSFLPNIFSKTKIAFYLVGFLIFVAALGLSQLSWNKINHYFEIAQRAYINDVRYAAVIAKYDREGNILFPADTPELTYVLVRNHKISGKRLIGSMFDPFYYAKPEDKLEDTEKKFFAWLKKEDIRIIVRTIKPEYLELFKKYPSRLKKLENYYGVEIYEVL